MTIKINKPEFITHYSKIWPYFVKYKFSLIVMFILPMVVGSIDGLTAWILKPFVDNLMHKQNKSEFYSFINLIPFIIIFLGSFQGFLSYILNNLNIKIGIKISNEIKLLIYHKLMINDASFFDRETSGQIQSRFNHDVDTACSGLLSNLKALITQVASSVALIYVIFINSWMLALFSILILSIAIYPLKTTKTKLKELINKQVTSSAVLSTHYNETYNGNRVITAYNLIGYQLNKFANSLDYSLSLARKMSKKTNLISFRVSIFMSICVAFTIWSGGYLVSHQKISISNFVSFFTAFLMLFKSIKGLGGAFQSSQISVLAMERLSSIIDFVPNIVNRPNALKLQEIKNTIEFQDVCFEYIHQRSILKNINLRISKGDIIALVGSSGGGKTTIASLLPRFYDVTSGTIRIDENDIRDIELESLRENISIVFQDNFLFAGTIKENIILGNTVVSDDQLSQAIRNSCLDEFIESLPEGVETEIGERGIRLSGGQRQRIAIARVFIKNSPIIILDEATSALDNKSEAVVQEAMSNLMKGRTVLIIAHRLSTIRNATKIVVINNGEIVEQGTHKQLIEKNHHYASLYGSQLNEEIV